MYIRRIYNRIAQTASCIIGMHNLHVFSKYKEKLRVLGIIEKSRETRKVAYTCSFPTFSMIPYQPSFPYTVVHFFVIK